MTAFGFKQRFVPAIIARTKTQTIRKFRKDGRYPPIGGELQLFTGLRTKNCVRLGTATAIEVYRLTIDWPHSWVEIDYGKGKPRRLNCWDPGDKGELDPFARADGFDNWKAMWDFFTAAGDPDLLFEGFVTKWADTFKEHKR